MQWLLNIKAFVCILFCSETRGRGEKSVLSRVTACKVGELKLGKILVWEQPCSLAHHQGSILCYSGFYSAVSLVDGATEVRSLGANLHNQRQFATDGRAEGEREKERETAGKE